MVSPILLRGKVVKVTVKEKVAKADGVEFPAEPEIELALKLEGSADLHRLLAKVGRYFHVDLTEEQPMLPTLDPRGDGHPTTVGAR